MTGKDLCIYILMNNLLDSDISEILDDALITEEQIAEHFKVGLPTVRVWVQFDKIKGFEIGNKFYISKEEYERIVKDGVK